MGDDEVECYSGDSYAQRPTAFTWQGERRVVLAIEAEWRQPEGKTFLVRTTDGLRFELLYNADQDNWLVKPA